MATGSDQSYKGASRVYTKQQPAGTTFNGNTITTEQVLDAGSLLSRLGVEMILNKAVPAKATFAINAGSDTQTTSVTITVTDGGGQPITDSPVDFDLMKSDSSLGFGATSITISGADSITTGTLLGTLTSKKALRVQTDSTGTVVLKFTDTAKSTVYIVAAGPFPAYASRILATGDYA